MIVDSSGFGKTELLVLVPNRIKMLEIITSLYIHFDSSLNFASSIGSFFLYHLIIFKSQILVWKKMWLVFSFMVPECYYQQLKVHNVIFSLLCFM